MKRPFIFLHPEVTRENAETIMEWLKDEEITKYLSDSENVSQDIEQVVTRVNLPVLTHLFNRNGRFYMINTKAGESMGFVRLIKKNADYEIVLAVGDRNNWDRKIGTSAIRESLKIAFFEFRAKKVIAKIHKKNLRSIRIFKNSGFTIEEETADFKVYSLTIEDYLQLLKGASSVSSDIYLTSVDNKRIKKIIDKLSEDYNQAEHIKDLERELEKAKIIDPEKIPDDIITMNSKALLRLNNEDVEVSLVYPEEADVSEMKLSILSPIGTAIIGYKEGNTIEWEVPAGKMEIHIKKLLYQPEAAGDYHL